MLAFAVTPMLALRQTSSQLDLGVEMA